MSQILHIFRKDIRHHWPEILVSLFLLTAYSWRAPLEWRSASRYGTFFSLGSGLVASLAGYLPSLLILSYCFLIFRAVQDEKLVGHRQFWITRPYEWHKLLAAKLLFILVLLNLPIFLAQLFLLRKAGFPVVPNLMSLLGAQLGLFVVFVWIIVPLATLTSGLGRALLTAIAVFFMLIGVTSLISAIPNAEMSVDSLGIAVSDWILFIAPPCAIVWQYARRRTWHTRGFLMGVGALLLLFYLTRPYGALIAKRYPPLGGSQPHPVRLSFQPSEHNAEKWHRMPDWMDQVPIHIPLSASDVQEGTVVTLDGALVQIDMPDSKPWSPGWRGTWQQIWPNTKTSAVDFRMEKPMYQKLKSVPVTLHVSIALSEYRESPTSEVTVQDHEFSVPGNGFCSVSGQPQGELVCRTPSPYHSLVASAALSPACEQNPKEQQQGTEIGHFLRIYEEDFTTPRLSPIETPQISFSLPRDTSTLVLCPGATIRLGTPVAAGHSRVILQVGKIKLEDYVLTGWVSTQP